MQLSNIGDETGSIFESWPPQFQRVFLMLIPSEHQEVLVINQKAKCKRLVGKITNIPVMGS